VTDLSMAVADATVRERLALHVDAEAKVARAMDALGPVADRRVVLLDADGGLRARQLTELGAVVTSVMGMATDGLPDGGADAVASFWSGFRGASPETEGEIAEAERIARPGGRLLVVHDYGRDDVSRLLTEAEREQALVDWRPRQGWFLSHGFKIRVVHCWWTFDSPAEATELLRAAFGERGATVGGGMTRPRLSYKVAVFHRTLGEEMVDPAVAG
jgi:hypothetical protein